VRKRAVVYVDGFNFYYGAVRGSPYKWLDLERFFRLLLPNDDIHAVRYFTALIKGPTSPNQERYLRALATRSLVEVVLGKFKTKNVACRVAGCTYGGAKFFQVPEEKRTDVNIGVRMLDDAYQNVCDRFVVVSGDSDLVPALNLVKLRFPAKQILVYVPTRNLIRGAAVELRSAADRHRDLPLNLLPHAQFSAVVADGGGSIAKPTSW
jgi:hypothetical protein